MKRYLVWVLLLLVLTGCGRQEIPESTAAPTVVPAETGVTEPVSQPQATAPLTQPADPVEELLASMTLEEKVGQLFVARYPRENAPEDVSSYHLGGYILFGRDFESKTAEEVRSQVESCQSAAKIPLIIGVDEEGGSVVRVSSQFLLRDAPFQSPQKLFAQGGMERILEDTAEKDNLLASLGINVNFAPVADVSTDPADFIYDRALGQNAEATAAYAAGVVAQMARDGMGSVLKHFPGYGNNIDTHTGIAVDTRPLEQLEQEDLLPFAVFSSGEGRTAILMSHNIITAMDPELPASLSPAVHDYLRQEMGYTGVILTDALDMGAVEEYAEAGIAVTALLAGNDILLICDYKTGIPRILEAVEQGTVGVETVDAACRRVLLWKQALGLI